MFSPLGILVSLVAPVFYFEKLAMRLCDQRFGLSTVPRYSQSWHERYEMARHWQPFVTLAFLSAFYLCAFLPFAFPDRIWRRSSMRWLWTVPFILLGVALGISEIGMLDFPGQR